MSALFDHNSTRQPSDYVIPYYGHSQLLPDEDAALRAPCGRRCENLQDGIGHSLHLTPLKASRAIDAADASEEVVTPPVCSEEIFIGKQPSCRQPVSTAQAPRASHRAVMLHLQECAAAHVTVYANPPAYAVSSQSAIPTDP
jgi:hypothetical protein